MMCVALTFMSLHVALTLFVVFTFAHDRPRYVMESGANCACFTIGWAFPGWVHGVAEFTGFLKSVTLVLVKHINLAA